MRHTIVDLAAAGVAVVLSLHLLNLVEELCTKLFIVRRGACVAYGTLEEIIARRPELTGRSLEDVFLTLTADGEVQGTPSVP
jgi:ABC-2 type transport system ATP-binding protein